MAFDRVTVTPLLTREDYLREGEEMRHCVGTYAKQAWAGRVLGFSIRADDGARSTLTVGVDPSGRLDEPEHRTAGNGTPHGLLYRVADRVVSMVREDQCGHGGLPEGPGAEVQGERGGPGPAAMRLRGSGGGLQGHSTSRTCPSGCRPPRPREASNRGGRRSPTDGRPGSTLRGDPFRRRSRRPSGLDGRPVRSYEAVERKEDPLADPSTPSAILTPPLGRAVVLSDRTGFARAVVAARRDQGMSVETLARLADLPVAVVAAVEDGEEPTADVRASLRLALAIRDPLVQAPAPVPVSARHARLMQACDRVRRERGGMTLVSDAWAWRASPDAVPSVVERVLELPSRRPLRTTLARYVIGVAGQVAAMIGLAHTPVFLLTVPIFILVVFVTVHGVIRISLMLSALWRDDQTARVRATDRRDDLVAEDEARRRRAEEAMLSKAHVVSRDGVTSVAFDQAKDLSRVRSSEAGDVYSVKVAQVSPRHVTVVVGTTNGDHELPWVPYSAELVDVLTGLVTGRDVPWTPELVLPKGEAPFSRA